MWKVFTKAGKPGWASIIPIYNTWVLFEIAGKPGWWALLNFIPVVGNIIFLVLFIVASLEIAKRFGKGPAFAIFGLVIFSIIGYMVLAFGKSQYQAVAATTPIDNPGMPPADPASPAQEPSAETAPVVPEASAEAPAAPDVSAPEPTPAPEATPPAPVPGADVTPPADGQSTDQTPPKVQ
jgi:hypothetical protein